ncbi:MAG: UDP-3-O-(3-hydroxymyristoyl)glucosamine N-acyltransferase [Proteobacteria bacterium]|nr:UDP-3-O-(3-hydroxymyristoyl)glucosamine N-acyltransferase [Pseudomonadota bacterium]HQR02963.1 UDP-3-O-(3-hydroxymyristoyl)glucosamine N-acyltransferase [Rhodocyclaceae bacterium]
MAVTLLDVVARLGGQIQGDGGVTIERIAPLDVAGPGDIAFFANPRYRSQLIVTGASAVILAPAAATTCPVAAIVTPQPYLYFARLAQWLHPAALPAPGVMPGAWVPATIPDDVHVGPTAVVDAGARIGAGTVISAGCVIGDGVEIGAGSFLYPNVTLYPGCCIGQRAILHAGVVIGADGFGFARDVDGGWVKVPQTGGVIVGDDVEIGANTTVDRGALTDTVIGNGVKLDNQIQVAHNVRIGDHTAIAGCVGIAGSARIGRRCTIGGGAIVLGHIEIADDVHISAGTLVAKSIVTPGTYTGTVPFMPHEDWLRNFSRMRHLEAMADKIRALEKRIAGLEQKS